MLVCGVWPVCFHPWTLATLPLSRRPRNAATSASRQVAGRLSPHHNRRYASTARLSQHGRSEGRPRMPLKLTSSFPSSSRPTSLRLPLWNGWSSTSRAGRSKGRVSQQLRFGISVPPSFHPALHLINCSIFGMRRLTGVARTIHAEAEAVLLLGFLIITGL